MNVVIVGGGAVGLATAIELSDLFDDVYLVEKEGRFGKHSSSRSSKVNHTGIYYPPGSRKAIFCPEANRLNRIFWSAMGVPYKEIGKAIVALDDKGAEEFGELERRAEANGVPGVRRVSGKELARMEPNIRCQEALYVPTSGIFDDIAYLKALEYVASIKGVHFVRGHKVIKIDLNKSGFDMCTTSKGEEEEPFHADFIVNSAGINAGDVARLICSDNSYEVRAVRGEAAIFTQTRIDIQVKMSIYQAPNYYDMGEGKSTKTLGVHSTSQISGEGMSRDVTLGPLYTEPDDLENYEVRTPPEDFHARFVQMMPTLRVSDVRQHQGGNLAKLVGTNDFTMHFDSQFDRCYHLLGIDSPGLTCALRIAQEVRMEFMVYHGLRQR